MIVMEMVYVVQKVMVLIVLITMLFLFWRLFNHDETVNNICASTVIGCTDPNASN